MYFTHTAAIVLRQFYLIRGSLSRALPLFVWAGIEIVLWGFITKYLTTVTSSGFNFVPSLLGAVLLWDFLIRVMQGVTMTGLLWGACLAVLYILLACWFFTRVYRYAVRTGLIARYSAETLS